MPPKKKTRPSEVQSSTLEADTLPEVPVKPEMPAPNSDATNPAPSGFRRHPEFYFNTGDVALCCSSMDDVEAGIRSVCRVDSAFLSRHSTIFAERLASTLAQGAQHEHYDGVPLVELDELVDDVSDLLSFMYNPAALLLWFTGRRSYATKRVVNLLDIASRFKVDGVRPFVAHLLERDWPTTLVDWLRQYGEITRLQTVWAAGSSNVEETCLDDLHPDPAMAIHIALKYDIPSILPAAFYCLSQIDLQDDWERWHLGKWRFTKSEDLAVTDPISHWRRTARWTKLDANSLLQVLLGRQALEARRKVLVRIYQSDFVDHSQKRKDRCDAELERLGKVYSQEAAGSTVAEPLQVLTRLLGTIHSQTVLCKSCRVVVRANVDSEMKKLWDDLPRIFSFAGEQGSVEDDGDATQVADEHDT